MLHSGVMAKDWTSGISQKLRCTLAILLVLLCSPVWAQDGQAPSVVTLVPINVTEASATLRAEVNPNGLATEVEFVVSWYYWEGSVVKQATKVEKVDAGDGAASIVVEHRMSGLIPHGYFIVTARVQNTAGTDEGGNVQLQLNPSHEASYDAQPPAIASFPVVAITERSAAVQIEVNPLGKATDVLLYLYYKHPGEEWEDIIEVGHQKVGSGFSPIRRSFQLSGLWRGFAYRVEAVARALVSDGGEFTYGRSARSFTTLGESGHNPPEFPNVALRVPIGSSKSFTRLVDPFDPDGDTVSIENISQPQHGTVTFDSMEWSYTPDSSYDGTDQFSVTVVDSKGERATRIVQIYDVRPKAFEFDLPLNWNVSDPPRPAGTLKLSTTVAGAFTGKATIFGESYALHGSFDQFDAAVQELDRKGLPPLVASLKLVPGVDGEMHLSAEIQAPELGSSYVAEGLPVGNAETSEGVAGLQYTAVLPMQEGVVEATTLTTRAIRTTAPDTPQGDGFLVGTVAKNGRARFTGRTGDGQTFTVGGRLQRNRQLQVGISTGKQPRDYIVGHLEFNRDETKSVGGSLGWLSYRSQKEYYARDFSRVAELKGAAYRKPKASMNLFGEAGGASELQVRLLDDSGAPVIDSAVSVNKAGNASFSGNYSLKLHLDRRSGLFRGTLKGNGISSKTTFMGALVQPLKRGQGHLLLNGPVGAVVLAAPER